MENSNAGQVPLAVVGVACRLPGGASSPSKLWDFLEEGRLAPNTVPASRFRHAAHYDGSHKPGTMRPAGGIFLSEQDVDLADFDASFFEIAGAEATATDPNQRQMLEVVYEALDSAGIPMDAVSGKPVAVFVASFAVDYSDIHARDPEVKPGNTGLGVGRAILANRLSWFYNLQGPSVTVDTACSGSLIALDMAARTLRSGEVDTAIIAASNLYLSPEHVIDDAIVGQAHSPSGRCHSFDAAADGYAKAEAVSCLILKRLDTALRDRDPIRAVVRGVAINANGRTNGIGSPSSEAQAAAIRKAYANAGIVNLNDTQFLECHGTGTKAGDAIEVAGVAQAFAASRDAENPLLIGSIKSNMGHAEPAAGLSGLIKTILSLEHGMIPGTPSFINPNPKIDFASSRVRPFRTILPWPTPSPGKPRRASVNSFGYGGANAHAILEEAQFWTNTPNHVHSIRSVDDLPLSLEDDNDTPQSTNQPPEYYTLVLSGNDALSLQGNIEALVNHLVNPRVQVSLPDLAYTLSQRRTHLWHRAFVSVPGVNNLNGTHHMPTPEIKISEFTTAKKAGRPLRLGFVFTGQGAQWPQMGLALLQSFPSTVQKTLEELDRVLQSLKSCSPPSWSLLDELTQPRSGDHIRQPEFSQPLVTALQICLLDVLAKWGVKSSSVVGHSSGEIAAAYAAGLLDRNSAIKAAFFRGHAVRVVSSGAGDKREDLGMLAVGTDVETVTPFLEAYGGGRASIACFNSTTSLTISGMKGDLAMLEKEIKAAGHFARLLQVDMAYHSSWMKDVGEEYQSFLGTEGLFQPGSSSVGEYYSTNGTVDMFSSVIGTRLNPDQTPVDIGYLKSNLVSPVLFDGAMRAMLSQPDKKSPDVLIEIGPSGALAGPIGQILKAVNATDVSYTAAWSRGAGAVKSLFNLAGHLFAIGVEVDLAAVNQPELADTTQAPRCIVDLPGYRWNHTVKYWHESIASKDWRFRPFITHDLIGSKVLGTPWTSPTWYKPLELQNIPWVRDHKMGGNVILPGAAFCSMALEAMYQKHTALEMMESAGGVDETGGIDKSVNDLAYGLRNVRLEHAMVMEEAKPVHVYLSLTKLARSSGEAGWHEFRISSTRDGVSVDHCVGQVRILQQPDTHTPSTPDQIPTPLQTPSTFALWYKTQREVGMDFGPSFRNVQLLEATPGLRECRALVNLEPPSSKHSPQSAYPLHPAAMDACFQVLMAPNAANERSLVREIQIPKMADEIIVNRLPTGLKQGLVQVHSRYSGRGRADQANGILGDVSLYDADTGALLVQLKGLGYAKLDADRKANPHVFDAVEWKPDVGLLAPAQIISTVLLPTVQTPGKTKLDVLVDLVAHKRPLLRVLEVHLNGTSDPQDISSLWLGSSTTDTETPTARQACLQYDFACPDSGALVAVQNKYKVVAATRPEKIGFLMASSPDEPGLGLVGPVPAEHKYDLVIVQLARGTDDEQRQRLRGQLEPLQASGSGFVVMVHRPSAVIEGLEVGQFEDVANGFVDVASPDTVDTGSPSGSTDPHYSSSSDIFADNVISGDLEVVIPNGLITGGSIFFNEIRKADSDTAEHDKQYTAVIPCLSQLVSTEASSLVSRLIGVQGATRGAKPLQDSWNFVIHDDVSNLNTTTSDVIIVVDELFTSLLTAPSPEQWTAIQALFATGRPVLWLTTGGASGSNPEGAMAHGLLRVVRRELASLDEKETPRVILDFDDAQDTSLVTNATATLLGLIANGTAPEPEYRVTQDGIIHIPRLVPDAPATEFRRSTLSDQGSAPKVTNLWENQNTVQLRGERVGALDLQWSEVDSPNRPLPDGYVQVETHAVGVNFKDVAAVMGIVPEDEQNIGNELSGVITRLGANLPPSKQHLKVGDRVVVLGWGTYVNRIQSIADCVQPIPDWMTFDEAASIPLAYATVVQSLIHLANLQPGQSVLIHSAAGGVGIAAVQLAKYLNAEIFVTVSSDEKRDYLATEYGIARDHMFYSRDASFATQIMQVTNNRGVDVVLNSLAGDLLDASWRIVAAGGTMVEIGKRDILDRHALAMEPFGRNCSFRPLDLSVIKSGSEAGLLGELMTETFELINARHIGPVMPINRYGFNQAAAALASIRKGHHIGKLVISRMGREDIAVPIRPLRKTLKLRHDASYLIIGGIKGLCGSLALHMARHGARHIIVCSRSGIAPNDEASARVIRGCLAGYNCTITDQKGDVNDADFVNRVFSSAQQSGNPIAGIIQGAMVLRDGAFESMQVTDYQTAISAKVKGTWNLHNASLTSPTTPISFFTLLSSVSGIIGNKGQANYASANAFLDAFASYRRTSGLPAHSLDLGAIEDVGYIAEQENSSLADRFIARPQGETEWTALDENALRCAFTASILQQQDIPLSTAPHMVTGLAHPLPTTSSLRSDPRLSYLFSGTDRTTSSLTSPEEAGQSNPSLQEYLLLRDATVKDTRALEKAAIAALAVQTTRVLRLEADTIEVGKPLAAYGLDSLSAVELRGWMRSRLGIEVTTLDITNARSLVELGEKAVGKL